MLTADQAVSDYSLGNPSKDRQRFVYAIVLISAADWSKMLPNFENVVQMPFESAFEHQTSLGFAQLIKAKITVPATFKRLLFANYLSAKFEDSLDSKNHQQL